MRGRSWGWSTIAGQALRKSEVTSTGDSREMKGQGAADGASAVEFDGSSSNGSSRWSGRRGQRKVWREKGWKGR